MESKEQENEWKKEMKDIFGSKMREIGPKAAGCNSLEELFLGKMSSGVVKKLKSPEKYQHNMKKEYNGVVGILFRREKPLLFALIHNQKTGNLTFPAGAREKYEASSEKTLARELLEETGLRENEYKARKLPIIHEFTYGPRKKERIGTKAVQHIYLVETNKKEIIPLDKDAKFHGWHTKEEVLNLLTFNDSKEFFIKAIKLI